MVMSDYCKQRVLSLHWQGHKVSSIREHLMLEAGILVSKQGIRLFLKHYGERGTIARKSGSSFPPKISPALKLIVEQAMREDDETTATELQAKLAAHGVYVSGNNRTRQAPAGLDLSRISLLPTNTECKLKQKPSNKEQLIRGILNFWATVDSWKCCPYIEHLPKVLPKVIEKHGDATGY